MPEKLGKEKIQQLLRNAIAKYVKETGDEFTPNQSAANYTGLADKLSIISNELPANHPKIFQPGTIGKYDITPAQVKGACLGHVESLKEHFKEALYLYIYGTISEDVVVPKGPDQILPINPDPPIEPVPPKKDFRKKDNILKAVCAILLIVLLFFLFKWITISRQLNTVKVQFDSAKNHFDTIIKDMRIAPYWPNRAEIRNVEGIYIVYTGSPQVRKPEPNRYHKVVRDILEVKYKEGYGYFTFTRYGPTINHTGYIQYEGPNQVTIHSYLEDSGIVKPKQSQMQLETGKDTSIAMSTSWSWGSDNVMIVIREVYIKKGEGGSTRMASNYENRSIKGKYLYWTKQDGKIDTFKLEILLLDTLPKSIQPLLDEKSIIAKDLDSTLFAKDPKKMKGN